jgi:hypothetical protein
VVALYRTHQEEQHGRRASLTETRQEFDDLVGAESLEAHEDEQPRDRSRQQGARVRSRVDCHRASAVVRHLRGGLSLPPFDVSLALREPVVTLLGRPFRVSVGVTRRRRNGSS